MKQYIHLLTMAAFSAILLPACSSAPSNSQNEIATQVSVLELKPSFIRKTYNTTGTANPTYGVQLNSLMTGNYELQTNPKTGKPFKLGDIVTKGQVIVKFKDAEYVNNIAIDVKKLNMEQAEQNLTKQKALYEKGGVTQTEVKNQEITVANTRIDYETGELNLEKMNVRAPFAGVIVDLPYFTPNVQVPSGTLVASLMDFSKMYMDINLPETAINDIQVSQPVFITHYTLPNDTLAGVITELSPAISMETRTFKGKIVIQNPDLKLRPGMFVKADIVVDSANDAIVIPKNVIQSQRNRKIVYIVERNTAIQRAIETGMEDENNIEVLNGLNQNESLIVRGFETLRDNSPVKVQR